VVTFDLYLDGKLLAQELTPASVENVVNLDVEDVLWAIEERGLCTALDASGERELMIVEHGDCLPQESSYARESHRRPLKPDPTGKRHLELRSGSRPGARHSCCTRASPVPSTRHAARWASTAA